MAPLARYRSAASSIPAVCNRRVPIGADLPAPQSWLPDRGRQERRADIKGYTPEYLEASSPRRQQIEEAVAKSGFSGPEAAQIAAHNTRDKKVFLVF